MKIDTHSILRYSYMFYYLFIFPLKNIFLSLNFYEFIQNNALFLLIWKIWGWEYLFRKHQVDIYIGVCVTR